MGIIKRIKLKNLFKYLISRAYMRFYYFFGKKNKFKEALVNGKKIKFNIGDVEQMYFYKECVREPENIFLYEVVSKSKITSSFIDVGANYGHVAKSITPFYESILLIDANPDAAKFLKSIFLDSHKHQIINKAIVRDPNLVPFVNLNVPLNSSGLGTIAHDNSILANTNKVVTHEVKSDSLYNIIVNSKFDNAYIKVDVEGLEYDVISSSGVFLNSEKFIFGFEALSIDQAKSISSLFPNHVFYFARFSFLNNSGSLTSSLLKILSAVIFGRGYIDVYKVSSFSDIMIDNYSQIIAMPLNLAKTFEDAIDIVLAEKNNTIIL